MRRLSITTVTFLVLGAFLLGAVTFGGTVQPFGSLRVFATDDVEDEDDELLATFRRSLEIISERSLVEVERDALIKNAIRGALVTLNDPYADFIEEEDFSEMMDRYYQPTYAGIGIRVTSAPAGALVMEVFRHGPAYEAGLQRGDIIHGVDGREVGDMPLTDLVDLIRGEAGTTVSISVERDGEIIDNIEIVREEIAQPTLDFDLVEIHGVEIGYVTIREFSDTTPEEMERALERLDGAEGLVIDVRGNPGGILQSAVDTAALLVPAGDILETRGRDEVLSRFEDDSPGIDIPMTVVMDGGTASGAEILAGVARERGSALLVGENSYGKGMVQSIYDVDGNGLRLTTAEYLLPSGYAIANRGLDPDIYISRTGSVEPSPRFATFDRHLIRGDIGPDVESLKSRLRNLGYFKGEVNGEYDAMAVRAVLEFQGDQGIPMTGELDTVTLGRILEMTGYVDSPLGYGELEEEEVETDNPAFRVDRQMLSAFRVHLGQLGLKRPADAPAAD
ncbi:MAG: S41 family peptidase [Bacillota bacterium]